MRSPLPGASDLIRSNEALEKKYGERLTEPLPADEKSRLAQLLYEDALNLEAPADRFVRWQLALELALKSGHTDVAHQTVERLNEQFQGDPFARRWQALQGLAEVARTTEQRLELAQRGLVLSDELIELRRYDDARPAAELALSLGRRARSGPFQIQARDTLADIDHWKELEEANTAALTTLAVRPDDPVALMHRGRYLCLVQGDWNRGLPLLRNSGVEAAVQAVARETAAPMTAEERIATAEAWRNLAFSDSSFQGFYSRALAWYAVAQPFASGEQLALIDRRLKEIGRQNLSPRQIDAARIVVQAIDR
ncbi:hypothetical protein Pla8534_38070 [Lignipirellula cremea]|uniref:Tetratricopeptide repeat protein n=1 Tax=Lignipirellula cremea TaxID=2528010 RepID=A0A518DVX5_9BACT|nr:hypothetical protein Pla8534_38070 [Lignipirellula cremea]